MEPATLCLSMTNKGYKSGSLDYCLGDDYDGAQERSLSEECAPHQMIRDQQDDHDQGDDRDRDR